MKLSVGSLSTLDSDSCRMLGQLLMDCSINITISRSADGYQIQKLFDEIDTDKNGYLDEDEFIVALDQFNWSMSELSLTQKQR